MINERLVRFAAFGCAVLLGACATESSDTGDRVGETQNAISDPGEQVIPDAFEGGENAEVDVPEPQDPEPTDPDKGKFAGLAKKYLLEENTLLMPPQQALAATSSNESLAPAAETVTSARQAIKQQLGLSNVQAGVIFSSVDTTIKVTAISGSGDQRLVTVREHTTYTYGDDTPEYSYKEHHTFTFQRIAGKWKIAGVEALNPLSDVSTERVQQLTTTAGLTGLAPLGTNITALRSALERDAQAIQTQDEMKQLGFSVTAADAAWLDAAAMEELAPTAEVSGPSELRLITGEVQRLAAGSYNYQAMVDFALKYALSTNPPYTRDTNDCTTFVSWALYKGGWKEAGKDSYPDVAWNHDDDDVWYWRCNTCTPRHSYTWGGVQNWQRFAYSKAKRVTALKYLSQLGFADIMQMEIGGGTPNTPEHTMIVTGRTTKAPFVPTLSYHSTDTKNKPLNLIIAIENGPYWAFRT
jgi:hypothetical protein